MGSAISTFSSIYSYIYSYFYPPDEPKSAEYNTVLSCRNGLVTAFLDDLFRISAALLANEIISEETHEKMTQLPSTTPRDKTTILVDNICETIKTKPKMYFELVHILEEDPETWAKDIAYTLHCTFRGRPMKINL